MVSINILKMTDFLPHILVTLIFPPKWEIMDVTLLVAFKAVLEIGLCKLP